MATRYWVGGSGTWDATTTTNWSASSGGAGGASAPTSADDVVFNSSSGAAPTVTIGSNAVCGAMTATAPTSGTLTFAFGTTGVIAYNGNWSNPASLFATTGTGDATFGGISYVGSGSSTLTTNGYSFTTSLGVNTSAGTLTLGGALTTAQAFIVTQGTFSTSGSNYSLTCQILSSNNSNVRSILLNASTVTCTSNSVSFATTNLTFNAGTSSIVASGAGVNFAGGGKTFYNVSFTNPAASAVIITGANTFNNFSITGRTSVGVTAVTFSANQTINGTLTLGAGTAAAFRTFLAASAIGTTRTLTVNSLAAGAAEIDFRDITIAGAASPISGTRFGDCKGNSGITFPAAKTVYYRSTGSADWSASWSATSGGASDATQFPLAQDTAVFPAATYPASGSTTTINADYNIGTIDMSLRTSNTMTLATSTSAPSIYGNWINGTGITITGTTGAITFAGRGSQTITSANVTFTKPITINTPSGSVTLQDTFTSNNGNGGALTITAGTFDAATYNVNMTGGGNGNVSSSNSNIRTIAIGSGTWTIATGTGGASAWSAATSTNLTVTGTGTISLTSASAKTFAGGGISYSGITLNQGGAGALTITGSNTFGNITNTYGATGATSILFTAGTTSTFSNWNASGTAGNLLTIGSVTAASHTLSKSSGIVSADYLSISRSIATGGASWYAGANSTNAGNNSGWIFSAAPSNSGKFFMLF